VAELPVADNMYLVLALLSSSAELSAFQLIRIGIKGILLVTLSV